MNSQTAPHIPHIIITEHMAHIHTTVHRHIFGIANNTACRWSISAHYPAQVKQLLTVIFLAEPAIPPRILVEETVIRLVQPLITDSEFSMMAQIPPAVLIAEATGPDAVQ